MKSNISIGAACNLLAALTLTANAQLFPFHADERGWTGPIPHQSESYLGTYLSEVTPELVDLMNLEKEQGAHVNQVVAESPADEAGLEVDDVIVQWNEQPVESAVQLTRLVRETPPGREIELDVIRNGEVVEVTVKIGTRHPFPAPEDDPAFDPSRSPWHEAPDMHLRGPIHDRPRLGIIMQPLTDQLASYFGLTNRLGSLISTVMDDLPAASAGLQAGDVVLAIDGNDVASPREVQEAVRRADGDTINVTVMRDRQEIDVVVPIDEDKPAPDVPEEEEEEPQTFPLDSM